MRSISQRELRNDNAAIVRAVEGGESFTVTRRGVPIAVLAPIRSSSDLGCLRPATKTAASIPQPDETSEVSTATVLDELRGDR